MPPRPRRKRSSRLLLAGAVLRSARKSEQQRSRRERKLGLVVGLSSRVRGGLSRSGCLFLARCTKSLPSRTLASHSLTIVLCSISSSLALRSASEGRGAGVAAGRAQGVSSVPGRVGSARCLSSQAWSKCWLMLQSWLSLRESSPERACVRRGVLCSVRAGRGGAGENLLRGCLRSRLRVCSRRVSVCFISLMMDWRWLRCFLRRLLLWISTVTNCSGCSTTPLARTALAFEIITEEYQLQYRTCAPSPGFYPDDAPLALSNSIKLGSGVSSIMLNARRPACLTLMKL